MEEKGWEEGVRKGFEGAQERGLKGAQARERVRGGPKKEVEARDVGRGSRRVGWDGGLGGGGY